MNPRPIATGLLLSVGLTLLGGCKLEHPGAKMRNEAQGLMTPAVVNFCLVEVRKIFPDFKLLGQFEFSAKAAEFVHDVIASEEEVAMIAPVEFKDLIGLRNTGWVGCKYRLTNGKLNFEKALSPGALTQLLRPA